MSVEVLTKSSENIHARAQMRRRGLDCVTPLFSKILYKARLLQGVKVGDVKKSWDVLKTIEFIERNLSSASAILDVGAYASEVLCGLHKLGFDDLTGIDLNPKLARMPYADAIKYVVGDFTETSFPAETFAAITAISVLEHGFSAAKVFSELSRILKPGGYLIASVDYWPEKIDTSGITIFGVDWTIFSKSELLFLIGEAAKYGLVPVGQLNFEASARLVNFSHRQYTFAWFALRKSGG
jgi:SAM-dependent methyltransferase